jgi:phage-related holin
MNTFIRKITSRKFWAAVVGVVISVMVAFGADNDVQEKTVGVITASATLIAYIVGEGLTDASHKDDLK